MAEMTGLSKSAVQQAIRCLSGRKLIGVTRVSITATPEYKVLKPWRR
jgi:DNA replication protein DnaD